MSFGRLPPFPTSSGELASPPPPSLPLLLVIPSGLCSLAELGDVIVIEPDDICLHVYSCVNVFLSAEAVGSVLVFFQLHVSFYTGEDLCVY